jgi:hypothetical protein
VVAFAGSAVVLLLMYSVTLSQLTAMVRVLLVDGVDCVDGASPPSPPRCAPAAEAAGCVLSVRRWQV